MYKTPGSTFQTDRKPAIISPKEQSEVETFIAYMSMVIPTQGAIQQLYNYCPRPTANKDDDIAVSQDCVQYF